MGHKGQEQSKKPLFLDWAPFYTWEDEAPGRDQKIKNRNRFKEVNPLMPATWAVINLPFVYPEPFLKLNNNRMLRYSYLSACGSYRFQEPCLHIHLKLEGKWGRILVEMKKRWLEGRATSITGRSVARISPIIHLTLGPDNREAKKKKKKMDVCSSSDGLPRKHSIVLRL